jgi:hypothetical protein
MSDRVLADRLAERVLGWRTAPGRFLTGGRSWIPRSRFRPFNDVRDALRLADALTKQYSFTASAAGVFSAEVRLPKRVGHATARNKARAVTLAVADALCLLPAQIRVPLPSSQINCGRGAH